MKKVFILMAALFVAFSCGENSPSPTDTTPATDTKPNPEPEPKPDPQPTTLTFAKGADISWVTEMEQKGYKFYDQNGTATECTALMKALGCNAVRYRVWVNPSGGWCNKQDVLTKALRAKALGLAIMIDFHYSDTWADPGKQTIPAGWPTDVDNLAIKVKEHTNDVLGTLKDNGVSVTWVQVGNETNTGMLWPAGEVTNANAGVPFAKLVNAGYAAVKAVYPDAAVIVHHSNAQDWGANKWFYDLVVKAGAQFDMIGLSLYPSYWANGGYPDWTPYCQQAVTNFKKLYEAYNKPVMLVEFGMPVAEPAKAKAAAEYLLNGVKDWSWFKGIFYWEPESEHDRNGYDYGAFASGKSTGVMETLCQ